MTKAPGSVPVAWTQKAEWIDKTLPKIPITMTGDKGLVYGKILVDDFPPYIEAWLKHQPRGLVIMPAHRWNKDFKHPNILRYDGNSKQLKKIKSAMRIARDRKPHEPLDLSSLRSI